MTRGRFSHLLGRAGGRLWRRRKGVACGLGLVAAALAAVLAWPMPVARYLAIEASPEILYRAGQPLYAFMNGREQWCFRRELTEVSPWLLKATVAAEDQRFWNHHGVDLAAVARAVAQNLRGGGVVSGASTLSMQVVKLAGQASNTWPGKARQAVGALRLELRVKKDAILASYLNNAPYGLNLVGCEAAARRYFGKPAAELTLPEAALVAALPKSPTTLMPLRWPERAKARRDYVLRRMQAEGMIGEEELQQALAAPPGAAWHEFPQEAPHLAMRLRSQRRAVRTTLDTRVQQLAGQALRRHLQSLAGEADDGAVLVVDAATAEVRAHVGSPDFADLAHAGQYDATQASRSPGSTLKPFIYGLAMEENLLFPSETLLDDTLDFGQYNPKNFDGQYHGLVQADAALAASLNVPAVMVFERLGAGRVLQFFRQAGLTTLGQPAERYGAGLALGNCEARLDELEAAYAMLASGGLHRPLRWTLDAKEEARPAQVMLSPGVCQCLMRSLRQPLPGEPDRMAMGTVDTLSPYAWKTGTSTGNRDAWAFMFNGRDVVGVWIGNHDGRPSPKLVGARAALPLAAEIFRSLPARADSPWPAGESEIKEVAVCALTGLPATPWCPSQRMEMVPRALYLNRRCDVHWPQAGGEPPQVAERWPGSARQWDLAKVEAPVIVDPSGGAQTQVAAIRTLQIEQPAPNAQYVLTGAAEGDRLRLRSSLDRSLAIHWFLDDRYLGQGEPQRPCYLDLAPGDHKLVAVAEPGQTATARFRVTQPMGFVNFE